jgi:3-isopropylmalate dehydrogenase
MLLRYSLGLDKQAQLIETSVRKALDAKDAGGLELRTADLGGEVGTKEIGDRVVEILKTLL